MLTTQLWIITRRELLLHTFCFPQVWSSVINFLMNIAHWPCPFFFVQFWYLWKLLVIQLLQQLAVSLKPLPFLDPFYSFLLLYMWRNVSFIIWEFSLSLCLLLPACMKKMTAPGLTYPETYSCSANIFPVANPMMAPPTAANIPSFNPARAVTGLPTQVAMKRAPAMGTWLPLASRL